MDCRYTFAMFQTHLNDQDTDTTTDSDSSNAQYRTIPTFLTLFIFGFLYELLLVWDALRLKNTIQIIGICIANLALLVYTAIQIDQIHEAVTMLGKINALTGSYVNDSGVQVTAQEALWDEVQPFLIAIPIILALGTIIMSFISWKLYQVFAWDILKQIGADYRMKKRFLDFQVSRMESASAVENQVTLTCCRSILPCSSSTSSSSSVLPCNSSSSSPATVMSSCI